MRFRFWKIGAKAASSSSDSEDLQVTGTGDASATRGGTAISGHRGGIERHPEAVIVTQTGDATASNGSVAISGNAQVRELHIHQAPEGVTSDGDPVARALTQLEQLDVSWRADIRRNIGGYEGGEPYHIGREAARDALASAIDDAPAGLLVYGPSGTGKSALLIDSENRIDRQIIGLNLRLLPVLPLDFTALLGVPLEQVLSGLEYLSIVLIIDGADAAAESHSDMLSCILQAAKTSAVATIVVASEDSLGAVRDTTFRAFGTLPEHRVGGLEDSEVDCVAAAFSHIRRVSENAQARELLRRPAIIDLLVRAETAGMPLTDADAMREVWHGLVRRNGRADRGRPEARDRVMRQLARQQLDGQPAETVLDHLDDEAVAGLRRDGLLRPAMDLPWQALPSFSHDLLRNYALAQVLLADGQPGSRLATVAAPRWALPAARLACQVLLAASADAPEQPLASRFLEAQSSFNSLAAGGFGDRWADVPSEALLTAGRDGATLSAAWPTVIQTIPDAGVRFLRILGQRHRRAGVVDSLISSPIITCLLDHGMFDEAAGKAAEAIREWEFSLIVADIPAGHQLRIRLREQLVQRCREAADRVETAQQERVDRLAARTPAQVAADEERTKQFRLLTAGGPGHRRRRVRRLLASELTDGATLEQLALLGRDLGEDGANLLREVAEYAPHRLAPALEEIGTGRALAEFSPDLLRTLTAAYYIDDRRDDSGFVSVGGIGDDGIRGHHWRGPVAPLAAYYRGPFQFMLGTGFREGVSVINRMLNVAAEYRVARLISPRFEQERARSREDYRLRLVFDGAERIFVGDSQTWVWYRGTGVGPRPCMSALQALELVCDRLIKQGLSPAALVPLLLDGCENLAMVGLVVGILIRHCEAADKGLDPFLVEPDVWELEFSRTVQEHSSLASVTPGITNPDRRRWNLREAAMTLAMYADSSRGDQLRQVGRLLEQSVCQDLEKARPGPGDSEQFAAFEEAAKIRFASVRGWAAALDQERLAPIRRPDGAIEIVAMVPDDVVEALSFDNEDRRRGGEAYGLINRYAARGRKLLPQPVDHDGLKHDIAVARSLWADPSHSGPGNPVDAPAAVAAHVIQAALIDRAEVESEDVVWAASLLLEVADSIHVSNQFADDESFFEWGADRSAAIALPLLLLPQAEETRRALSLENEPGREQFHRILHRLGGGTVLEAKLFLARGLDAVWLAPCLSGVCPHRVAISIIEESARRCVLGDWDVEGQRQDSICLEGDIVEALADVSGDRIIVPLLSPGIRASASAALNGCCTLDGGRLLSALLDAHARGMTVNEHQYQHSSGDALVAARALLTVASVDDGEMCRHLSAIVEDIGALAEFLQALAASAEESPALGASARRMWPTIMDYLLDLFDAGKTPRPADFRGAQALAALIPIAAYDANYLHRELQGEPQAWTAILDWVPQIERWLQYASGVPDCVDNLVSALRSLTPVDQARWGLPWLEILVSADPVAVARRSWHLPNWLREIQGAASTEAQEQWQRIVDTLTVAGDTRLSDLGD